MINSTRKCRRWFWPWLAVAAAMTATTTAAATEAGANAESPTLYVAALRPSTSAPEVTAYGTATLRLNPESGIASITVSYSNLSSARASAELKLGGPGDDGHTVKTFRGDEQPIHLNWSFEALADHSSRELREALSNGLIFVTIGTTRFPAGELRGQFIRSAGSRAFTPPASPPPLSLEAVTQRDAARFLIQATFGPTKAEIDRLASIGYDTWIQEQIALPPTSLLKATRADFAAFPPVKGKAKVRPDNLQAGWWKLAVTGPDQLRQRVAFALSEILVVSDRNGMLKNHVEGVADYYDLLARSAFGNYRQLLEDVTLSPVMGVYLSHLRNAKADLARGTSPDENYARELMQLFTIGLNELQPDGTYQLDEHGLPVATYDQATVAETARVFTGWAFHSEGRRRNFRARPNFLQPMMLYPAQHDDGEKVIIRNLHLPARQGGERDLAMTLDALFNHPNTGPYVCRQLIQRLVTSNPSPGYVYRVARIFADNGRGVRGDLGAVVRAILLDYEARAPALADNISHGKLKEPLLQTTALLRACDGAARNGRYHLPKADDALGQAPLHAPTVFNFFAPDYVLPGPLAAAGLVAPEYQIFTATTAITVPNFLRALIATRDQPRDDQIALRLDPLVALADLPEALLDTCDLIFCGGTMSSTTRERITAGLNALPARAGGVARARCALELTVTSADAAIQR